MEFGIYLRPAKTFGAMKQLTQFAENNNFTGVFLNDHVHGFKSGGKEPYLEAWTIISALAPLTNRIKLGHIVLFNSLRNPAYLAKSITSLDIISSGRYELMIGAGWNNSEYEAYDLMERGRGMPSAKERVDRLKESLKILRFMLNNEVTNFEGLYWNLKNAYNIPQPVQKNMRISVGGSKDRMIKITAKYADGINVGSGLNRTQTIIDKLKPELKKHNKLLDDYYISGFGSVTIAKNDEEYKELLLDLSKRTNKSIEEIEKDSLIGTPDILVKKFDRLKKLGVKMYIVSIQPAESLEEILARYELFVKEVMVKLNKY